MFDRVNFRWRVGLPLVCILGIVSALPGLANNLQVSNVVLTNQDTVNHTYDIQFHIQWDNSWRDVGAADDYSTPDKNWDAAWVFVKYSVYDDTTSSWGPWHHAVLDGTYSVVPTTCGAGSDPCAVVKFADNGDGVYRGVFVYRSSYNEGSGSNSWDITIRWRYGDNGVADTAKVRIKVFGIEMVLIPTGSFYVGDSDADPINCFYTYGCDPSSGCEFLINSEDAIDVGTTDGYLYYDADNGTNYAGDQTGPIPASFPKGYNAFYIMKYEISQIQYCEFLNTLTSDQANNRIGNHYGSYRNYIKLASNGKYGCDANNNAGDWGTADYTLMNEADDGQWVACNYLSYADVLSYADWAALRPFTELEFEKACRGPNSVVDDEFPWGDSTINATTYSLADLGMSTEYISANYSTDTGNAWYATTKSGNYPVRVGIFATSTSDRRSSGASFYGVMDLAGNLTERTVTVGDPNGRDFDGSHGDGELDTTGTYDVATWPDHNGLCFRGGSWYHSSENLKVANRSEAARANDSRNSNFGGRCARTAPP